MILRSVPLAESPTRLAQVGGVLRYVLQEYDRFYIDLRGDYGNYTGSFSAKSRSTLRRKARKFAERSGGDIDWRSYTTPQDMNEFYPLARQVSAETYQERLLDAGLPDSQEFFTQMLERARYDGMRGYLLFLERRPVAYLYCPVQDGVVTYGHLGYLASSADLSPGTVLLWLAIESLFSDGTLSFMDFTEGGDLSQHSQKRLFGRASVHCADVLWLRGSARNIAVVLGHASVNAVSESAGRLLDTVGLKKRIRSIIRKRS